MSNARAELGRAGEELATDYLSAQGWSILARNWRCKEGEADIVGFDPEAGALVIVEVKSRSGTGYGQPLEAITYAKACRLRRIAATYARQTRATVRLLRVDAIGVLMPPGRQPELLHARGIEER